MAPSGFAVIPREITTVITPIDIVDVVGLFIALLDPIPSPRLYAIPILEIQ